jgi:hypothetical protein
MGTLESHRSSTEITDPGQFKIKHSKSGVTTLLHSKPSHTLNCSIIFTITLWVVSDTQKTLSDVILEDHLQGNGDVR